MQPFPTGDGSRLQSRGSVTIMRIAYARSLVVSIVLIACIPSLSLAAADEAYAKLPLSFEANRGQTDSRVKFLSRGSGYSLFLTATESVLSLKARQGRNDVLRLKLLGSNRAPRIEGRDELSGKSNYFIGNDPKKWRTNIPTFARVLYRDVYPGVDVVFYGNQRTLENDLIVAPGANPKVIALAFDGARSIVVDGDGGLVLGLPSGNVRLQKPAIYQLIDGARSEVAGNYVIRSGRDVGFEVAAYDLAKPLVIDPVLVYSSYLGGNGTESGNAIVVDDSGNAYITGTTTSSLFPLASAFDPTLSGGSDAFITKINPAGSALVYSTFLGGSNTEIGSDISVDSSQNVYVTGRTASSDFPTINAFDSLYSGGTDEDAFVTRINAAGSALVYSTYLSGNFGSRGFGIAANNSQGYAYVIGTTSTGFPVTAGAFEATNFNAGFLTKLCTNCTGASSLVYSTFLAHTGTLEGRTVAADVAGNAYVAGNLTSGATSFATAGAFQTTYGGGSNDVFVAKFNTNFSGASALVYATFLGGGAKDSVADSSGNSGKAMVIDETGDVYLTGSTSSTNFPLQNAYQGTNVGLNDVFLTKLNPSGSALIYSTYLGNTGDDFGRSVAVNIAGSAYVTGVAGPNFPIVAPLPTPLAGVGFVTKFTPSGSAVVYSTRLSGVTNGSFGVAVDSAGNAFATGSSNGSIVTFFPFQPTNGGGGTDGWVTVIADPTIIGRVSDENGNPLAGATVNLTGASTDTTTTDANGGYTFGLLTQGGDYTVSVVAPTYIFGSAGVTNLQKNVRRDFGPSVVGISGQVTLGAGGLSAVTMTLSGGKSSSVPTDGTGHYAFANLPAGRDYTVTPTKSGYGFAPSNRSFINAIVNATGADFAATASIGEASPAGNMMVGKGGGTSITATYTVACGALGHVIYLGTGPIASGLVWNTGICGLATTGFVNFDMAGPPPGSFWYFVVVGQTATNEGPYGRNKAGAQEPEAIGVGTCDLPQNLAGSCP
jgi:hypothetical protein